MQGVINNLINRVTGRAKKVVGFVSKEVTDRGLVRQDNQDSFVSLSGDGFFCVADGMGGGSGGALASEWTAHAISESWHKAMNLPVSEREQMLKASLNEVNDRIHKYAADQGYKMMGTTLAVLLQDRTNRERGRIFHVGDSRIYRFRNNRLDQLTSDHTIGNELATAYASTGLDIAKSLQSRSNPLTHILTRAVGTEAVVREQWKFIDIQRGDRFLLCSDGVHDMLSNYEIAEILKKSATPRSAAARIEEAVRRAGAADNYTIICAYARLGYSDN